VSPRESNSDRLACVLQGQQAIADAADAARAFASSQWLTGDEAARLCIVVEELVANLYDHGGLKGQDEVGLDFTTEPDGIRVTIIDPGAPFDPWTAPRKIESPDRGGGVGIDIIRAWAQFVDYRVSDEGNRLEFLLPVRWDN
jgi:anti-sigma regulatory factor (Ser/Thr protein kinase)